VEEDRAGDQELLRATTQRFLADRSKTSDFRTLEDADFTYDAQYLREGAELGWFSLLVPDELGGGSVSGNGLADAAVIAAERGKLVQPAPFVEMNVVAWALSRYGTDRQRDEVLPALMAGEVATWAYTDPNGRWDGPPGVIAAAVDRGAYQLCGAKSVVQDAHRARWMLITAADSDGRPVQFLIEPARRGVVVEPLASFDLSRRFATVRFEDVAVTEDDLVGDWSTTTDQVREQMDVAAALTVAETVGAMDHLLEMTVEYAKDRVAFGRPIGSFQALKHLLADLSMMLELSRSAGEAAIAAIATSAEGASLLASAAKVYGGEAAVDISQGCFQVYGGIGYTWEHDLHLYLRRASANNILFGDPRWHRERILRLGGVEP
jgi:alkylation response protein AidB-like acyl-CoA dehydrogenase